jgi:hypothetical protein
MLAVQSASVVGVDAHPVLVEVDVARGLPAWSIVGLASNAVKEARERVASALVNSGFEVPGRRVTVLLITGQSFDTIARPEASTALLPPGVSRSPCVRRSSRQPTAYFSVPAGILQEKHARRAGIAVARDGVEVSPNHSRRGVRRTSDGTSCKRDMACYY